MYIGKQKILQEEKIGDGLVKVTLETIRYNNEISAGLGDTEEIVYPEEALKAIKTKKAGDLNEVRSKSCIPVVAQIIDVLLKNSVKMEDINHIFQGALGSIEHAKQTKMRKVLGVEECNQTLYQLKDELLG